MTYMARSGPELVAAMPFEAFDACIREIDPYIEENDIRRILTTAKITDASHRDVVPGAVGAARVGRWCR